MLIFGAATAQPPTKPSSVEIYNKIRKLNFLGTVLYVAAHPDDENTRLISYLANHYHARTVYLSLTRGDGGQNLIGPELRELLGVIRTQELIEARKLDGGEQLFTRANDFGYSKNPDETFRIWDKNLVLEDVVLAIRKLQPDIIINRFDHRSPGTTHGHHTASAMLSLEAIEKAANSAEFPHQLKALKPRQARRAFFNTSWWFYGSREKFEQADKSALTSIDIGSFFASRGVSNQEIAARSRSCHRSQGFGTTGTRGTDREYLELIYGDMSPNTDNLFNGIDTSWGRVQGGIPIGAAIDRILKNFDFTNPSGSIPALLEVHHKIGQLSDEHWKTLKLREISDIIADCTGLFLEARTDTGTASPSQTIVVETEAINRSNIAIELHEIRTNSTTSHSEKIELLPNVPAFKKINLQIPPETPYSAPYWLQQPYTEGMYAAPEQLIGLPEAPPPLYVDFNVSINSIPFTFRRFVVHKFNDDANGEVYRPFSIVPDVSLKFESPVTVFTNRSDSKEVRLLIEAQRNNVSGIISPKLPAQWTINPPQRSFTLKNKGDHAELYFTVSAPSANAVATISAEATVDNRRFHHEIIPINYEHIAAQTVLLPATAKLVKPGLKINNERIGYIMGAGDEVPDALRKMGYDVTLLDVAQINKPYLARFDVIITGIRAYNKITGLGSKQQYLLEFVRDGGNLIVQYNTLDELVTKELAPYKLKISRDRITDEGSSLEFLQPNHRIMRVPNALNAEDFKGWVQEFGLYFPGEWGPEFTPLLSGADANEKNKEGLLLVSKYGKGHYIYTGLSFFRQLPAGVPGAFRLLANLISAK